MSNVSSSEAEKAVVRRNTEEVQGEGRFDVFDEVFADDFADHTPQPNTTPDKAGVRKLYTYIRDAFPDFHAEIHWQLADGDRVTTYKTYHGTHEGPFLGIAPTHRKIHFESVDVMRVRNGKITDHWGVGNLLSLMRQLTALPITTDANGAQRFKASPTAGKYRSCRTSTAQSIMPTKHRSATNMVLVESRGRPYGTTKQIKGLI